MHVRCRGISAQHYWSGFQSTSSTRVIDRVTMKNAWGNKLANNNKIFFARQSSYTRTRLGHVLKLFLVLCYVLSTFWACVCTGPWLAMHTCIYERAHPTLTTSLRACSSIWVTCPKGVGDRRKAAGLWTQIMQRIGSSDDRRAMHAKLQTFFT